MGVESHVELEELIDEPCPLAMKIWFGPSNGATCWMFGALLVTWYDAQSWYNHGLRLLRLIIFFPFLLASQGEKRNRPSCTDCPTPTPTVASHRLLWMCFSLLYPSDLFFIVLVFSALCPFFKFSFFPVIPFFPIFMLWCPLCYVIFSPTLLFSPISSGSPLFPVLVWFFLPVMCILLMLLYSHFFPVISLLLLMFHFSLVFPCYLAPVYSLFLIDYFITISLFPCCTISPVLDSLYLMPYIKLFHYVFTF